MICSARDLTAALSGFWSGTSGMAKCPAHDDRSPSLSIRDGYHKVLVKCHAGCEQEDVIAALQDRRLWPSRDRKPGSSGSWPSLHSSKPRGDGDEVGRIDLVRRLWREAKDPRVNPVLAYLNYRGLPPLSDDQLPIFRYHPNCPFSAGCVPTLICRFSPIENDPGPNVEPTAILRIRLDRYHGDRRKLCLGPSRGQVIKLYRDVSLGGVGIVEGVEKGLALSACDWRPIWCTSGVSIMRSFPLLAGVEAISVFCDRDEPGRAAALTCAGRWHDAGREARILQPPSPFSDWDDWYVGGGK
ncbi:toprim domain-containing protein [Rhizobium leguminosarum]|uniref:toprim domain-containing protein n=1 Tax=Rhizobium leguminosarum TaxID=384 RepID=UPI0017B3DDCE|nr:toprim domain-containing protein [Rhizobium leguminosarum]MBB4326967.1 hypothetical protein [Rhizobium leguminosarum]MBB4352632.1 hypothetical protein [Rhizobium leguminosarum]MBB4547281.1 hypothetical protein [Rhizobium leguminosarum]MBB4559733.1 hypothetical protein [Rhizobium leguminosarum]